MIIAVLLLCSGIDMIGDMPSRVVPGKEPEVIENLIPEEEEQVDCGVHRRRKPLVDKTVSPDTKPELPDIKPEVDDTKPELPDTKPELPDTKPEATDTNTSTNPEEIVIPFPEGDELEPGEKEVEAKDDSEAGYKYYVYRSHNCDPCIRLVNELQKNVDEKDLILSYERTTKSGKHIWYVPVLEVYKDGKLVHQQTGYTSFKSIKKRIDEAN